MIDSFTDEYFFLSNFYLHEITYEGIRYPSTEHAYQAAKTVNRDKRMDCLTMTAGQSKRWGKTLELRPNWNNLRLTVMADIIGQKFHVDSPLAVKLVETWPHELVEGNHWNDTFWGVCRGVGDNWLGRILMNHRIFLQCVGTTLESAREKHLKT